ncbi:IS200/IS605 family transposase [Enterococcus hirae]|nr:IS200/IS605 family transposase [Enterococcus hirae]
MKKATESLSHTVWKCKYHIVFAPKYRCQIIYGQYKASIGEIIRELCERKGVEILEANACPDHIHMLVSIPPKISASQFLGDLKGKSSLMIFDRHVEFKYRYENRKFWCRGYYVDTVRRNKKKSIAEYIRNQLREEHVADQLTLFEEVDPFNRKKH